MDWEGAELCYYINGESNSIALSNVQFAMIAKLLGLEIKPNGEVTCYSDNTLKRFATMQGNPLNLKPQ